jgi:hypothetical protein
MTIRKKIEPLLEDFRKANGKGSVAHANMALIKMVETLVAHIEQHVPVVTNYTMPWAPPVQAAVPAVPNGHYVVDSHGHFTGLGYAAQVVPHAYQALVPDGWNIQSPANIENVSPEDITGTISAPSGERINYCIEKSAAEKAAQENGLNVEEEVIRGTVNVMREQLEKRSLLDAVHKLHDANYVIGLDYTSIVEHLEGRSPPGGPPDDQAMPVKTRARPGPKPKPDHLLKRPRRVRKPRG